MVGNFKPSVAIKRPVPLAMSAPTDRTEVLVGGGERREEKGTVLAPYL